MESGAKNNKRRLVKTRAQAQFTFNVLLQGGDWQNLESGIYTLLGQINNPGLNTAFNSYPGWLGEHDVTELLSGDIEVEGIKGNEVRMAGLLTALQLLLHFAPALRGKPDPEDKRFEAMRYILGTVTLENFVSGLQEMVITVVGTGYYKTFLQKTDIPVGHNRPAKALECDPELQEHIGLMLWFAMARLFLESIYVYFDCNP